MNLQQIKNAVDAGFTVHYGNDGYVVEKDNNGDYCIVCLQNGYRIGLTWLDGETLNGTQAEFYIK